MALVQRSVCPTGLCKAAHTGAVARQRSHGSYGAACPVPAACYSGVRQHCLRTLLDCATHLRWWTYDRPCSICQMMNCELTLRGVRRGPRHMQRAMQRAMPPLPACQRHYTSCTRTGRLTGAGKGLQRNGPRVDDRGSRAHAKALTCGWYRVKCEGGRTTKGCLRATSARNTDMLECHGLRKPLRHRDRRLTSRRGPGAHLCDEWLSTKQLRVLLHVAFQVLFREFKHERQLPVGLNDVVEPASRGRVR